MISATGLYFIDRVIYLFSVYVCSAFIFLNYTRIKASRKIVISLLSFSFVVSILCQWLGGTENLIIKLLYILVLLITLLLFDKANMYFNSPLVIISIAITLCVQYLSTIIAGTCFYFIYRDISKIIITLTSSVLQFCICVLVSKIKIIKRGFDYLSDNSRYGLGLLLSSYILGISLLLTQTSIISSEIGAILFVGVPLVIVSFVLWIRDIVQRYYKNKLQDRMDEYTQKEMEDKDKRIERLEAEVTALAKQVHRDNHLMTSVDRSVQELAACDSAEQREQIVGEIHTLYLERNDSIAKEQQKNKILPSTGFALIDSSLSELYVKAAARGISFDLTVNEEPYYLVNNIISQTDLQTLLCDHIKDAIIAVESAGITDGRILVTIEKKDSIYEIAIRDNGVDFDVDTLARIGKEQVTTHADDGGSGIGFMTTFETLHKTKGSLIITEYEQKTPFSKSIAFVFDGLNRFVISTYRKEELEKGIDRDDLLII